MENKIKEVRESNSNAFSYTGDIHVKVVEDDRVYYENYFHNNGTNSYNNTLHNITGMHINEA